MAGHSKFKNIMHRKGAQDKKRSAMFSKLSREITVAAKMGLPDPDMNARLRAAVLAAKAQSMPKDNIQRSIDKASSSDAESYEEIRYEGFGPGGVGVIVEVLTDNRNRSGGNVRAIFGKNGGNLAENGAVSFMFDRVGQVEYPASAGSEEDVLDAAIEAGASDVESDEEGHTVITALEDLGEVASALEQRFGAARSTKVVWRPKTTTPVGSDDAATVLKLIDALDDDDDVQNVYANVEISDEDMERLAS